MFALVNGGSVTKYPYSYEELRIDNPSVSFPAHPDLASLGEFGFVEVRESPQPDFDPFIERIAEATPIENGGEWVQQWQVVTLTSEESAAYSASKASEHRGLRDSYLAASDWTQLSDSPLSDADKQAWASYRGALRDVPSQAGFPKTVNWPISPAAAGATA